MRERDEKKEEEGENEGKGKKKKKGSLFPTRHLQPLQQALSFECPR